MAAEDAVTPGVALEETAQLIAADKVSGTPVYDLAGERLGAIETVMLDKRSGRVAYAILAFGGFLGIGERFHPLPWSMLRYDVELGGYRVDLDRDRLEGAPSYAAGEAPDLATGDWNDRIAAHYREKPFGDVPL